MANLTRTTKGTNTTINMGGYKAYKTSAETELTSQVLTSFYNEQKYYGDNSSKIVHNVKTLANQNREGAEFVAKLAKYARNEMNMRTISQVLVVELANSKFGKEFSRKTINTVCLRVDDMVNILSHQLNTYGKPIPNSMKKGLADAFKKFDEYQLAKYNRKTDVKLKDILRICHVKPTDDDMSALFKKVIDDTLSVPYTWETELSAKGNNAEVWQELIGSKKLGYMATLRNLNNMLKVKVNDNSMNLVYDYLTNPKAVENSKQLPFRFYSAYRQLEDNRFDNHVTSKTYDALEDALELSVKNIENLNGKTAIAGDVSYSMTSRISDKSSITCSDISALMLVMANQICDDALTLQFDTSCVPVAISKRDGIISKAKSIANVSGGTDCSSVVQYLLDNKIKVDRIIMFSDNESNSGYSRSRGYYFGGYKTVQQVLNDYRKQVNPDVWFHAIDLLGYGTVQVLENDPKVNLVAGWSEKLLQFIPMVEAGADGLVETIKNYEI